MKTQKDLRNGIRRLIRNWGVPVGCGLFFLFLLKFVFFIGYVPSASMEPAISEGSMVFGVRIFGEPERGDVVVFKRESLLLVKRIAGIPGDTVNINGEPMTLPDGRYFVLGDNAELSLDSRYWDEPFVPRDCILAVLPFI